MATSELSRPKRRLILPRESLQLLSPTALTASNNTKVGNSSVREQPAIAPERPLARRP